MGTKTPVNVRDLVPGDVVRIQLLRGHVVIEKSPGVGFIEKNVIARPYRRSSLVGFLIVNNFQQRVMHVDFQDLTLPVQHFSVRLEYRLISVIEKQISGAYTGGVVGNNRIPTYVPVLGVF